MTNVFGGFFVPSSGSSATGSSSSSSSSSTIPDNVLQMLNNKIDKSTIGQPNGVLQLDSSSKIRNSNLNSLSISDVYVVANNAARDALTVQTGDVAKVTNPDNQTYIYDGTNWITINASNLPISSINNLQTTLDTKVETVNNKSVTTGTKNVSITTSDVPDSTNKRYVTDTQLYNIEYPSIGISSLQGFNLSNPINGQPIVYDSFSQNFIQNKLDINTIDTMNVSSVVNGSLLQYDAATNKWKNKRISDIPELNAASSLKDLSDVLVSDPPITGSSLTFDGNYWVDQLSFNNLNTLSDCLVTAPTNEQVLQYETSTAKWKNKTLSLTPGITSLAQLSDILISSPATNQILVYNNQGKWVNANQSALNAALSVLTDCVITSPSSGNLLFFNGTNWINSNISLSSLSNALISSPTDLQYLGYNNTTSKWENKTLPTASLSGLSDIALLSVANNQQLKYDSATSKWVNFTPSASTSALSSLTDVNITSPSDGHVLTYNNTSSKWISSPVSYPAMTTIQSDITNIKTSISALGSTPFGLQSGGWSYTNSNVSASWLNTNYVPSGWSTGAGGFGFGYSGTLPIVTTLAQAPQYFFRKTFTVLNAQYCTGLNLAHQINDGFICYINGTEVYRYNCPTGDPLYASNDNVVETPGTNFAYASTAIPQSLSTFTTILLPITGSNPFVSGTNILSVRLFQSKFNSYNSYMDIGINIFKSTDVGISSLNDTNVSSLANGDILTYNSSTSKWVNGPNTASGSSGSSVTDSQKAILDSIGTPIKYSSEIGNTAIASTNTMYIVSDGIITFSSNTASFDSIDGSYLSLSNSYIPLRIIRAYSSPLSSGSYAVKINCAAGSVKTLKVYLADSSYDWTTAPKLSSFSRTGTTLVNTFTLSNNQTTQSVFINAETSFTYLIVYITEQYTSSMQLEMVNLFPVTKIDNSVATYDMTNNVYTNKPFELSSLGDCNISSVQNSDALVWSQSSNAFVNSQINVMNSLQKYSLDQINSYSISSNVSNTNRSHVGYGPGWTFGVISGSDLENTNDVILNLLNSYLPLRVNKYFSTPLIAGSYAIRNVCTSGAVKRMQVYVSTGTNIDWINAAKGTSLTQTNTSLLGEYNLPNTTTNEIIITTTSNISYLIILILEIYTDPSNLDKCTLMSLGSVSDGTTLVSSSGKFVPSNQLTSIQSTINSISASVNTLNNFVIVKSSNNVTIPYVYTYNEVENPIIADFYEGVSPVMPRNSIGASQVNNPSYVFFYGVDANDPQLTVNGSFPNTIYQGYALTATQSVALTFPTRPDTLKLHLRFDVPVPVDSSFKLYCGGALGYTFNLANCYVFGCKNPALINGLFSYGTIYNDTTNYQNGDFDQLLFLNTAVFSNGSINLYNLTPNGNSYYALCIVGQTPVSFGYIYKFMSIVSSGTVNPTSYVAGTDYNIDTDTSGNLKLTDVTTQFNETWQINIINLVIWWMVNVVIKMMSSKDRKSIKFAGNNRIVESTNGWVGFSSASSPLITMRDDGAAFIHVRLGNNLSMAYTSIGGTAIGSQPFMFYRPSNGETIAECTAAGTFRFKYAIEQGVSMTLATVPNIPSYP